MGLSSRLKLRLPFHVTTCGSQVTIVIFINDWDYDHDYDQMIVTMIRTNDEDVFINYEDELRDLSKLG